MCYWIFAFAKKIFQEFLESRLTVMNDIQLELLSDQRYKEFLTNEEELRIKNCHDTQLASEANLSAFNNNIKPMPDS